MDTQMSAGVMMAVVATVTCGAELAAVRLLFRDYRDALGDDTCFPGFEAELAALPEGYLGLWLAGRATEPLGCIGLAPGTAGHAWVKRLYVRPTVRAKGVGWALLCAAIDGARAHGVARLGLETLPVMAAAARLYARAGFRPAPDPGDRGDRQARYLELDIRHRPGQV